MTPQDLVLSLIAAVFVEYDPDAARPLLAPDYIQHNPNLPTGADGLLNAIPVVKDAGLTVTTHRVIAEGDYVVLHNTFENADMFGAPELVSFDVFRIEDGVLAEHWDNLQAPPATTASGRSMTDGPTEITDRDKTADNKAIVEGFVNDVFLGGDVSKAADYIVAEPGAYLQHNPLVPDGLEALGAAFVQLAEAGQGFSFSKVHLIVAEGNFVFTMTEGAMGDTPTAFFDLWRVEDGKIVEHWDTIEAIPAEMAHDNGKF
ncbi:MAG: nuclear transport factor 2 family protein [Pseudomonadota bacterium]